MENAKQDAARLELISQAMDCMPEAVTIISPQGVMLYYNKAATEVLDRKPEYIGQDIHNHHSKPATNPRVDAMIQAFAEGRTEPFRYIAKPYGYAISVALAPILVEGEFLGCVQSVRRKED